jgi:hypothetical protein
MAYVTPNLPSGGFHSAVSFVHMPAFCVYAGSALNLPPTWGVMTFPSAVVGVSYTDQWTLQGTATPITYSLLSGSLPTGLALTNTGTASGRISGTPTAAGAYGFTLRASNAYGNADQAFTINVASGSGGGGAWTWVS